MIYLDNAATTFIKPKSVYKRLNHYLKKECGNPGRSSHLIATKSAEAVYEARENIAQLFNLNMPERIVFSMNATHALNLGIKTLIHEKCHVIISDVEHNSVLRPVHSLCEKYGIEYSIFKSDVDNVFFEIEKHIRPDTKAIVSTLISNVDGREIPLFALSALRRKHNLKLIIDASQAAGHKNIDLDKNECDAIAMPGHKALFGIQGVGVCIFPCELPHATLLEGGSGHDSKSLNMPNESPEKYEAGTLPTPSIVALSEGVKFILSNSVNSIEEKIDYLTNYCKQKLYDMDGIKVIGGANGVISFISEKYSPETLASYLNQHNICTRAGFHCAPLAHNTLGTYNSGTVRVSLSYFNSKQEIDVFITELNKIIHQTK